MKCDRCQGKRYIEPRDGKRLDCPKCGGKGTLSFGNPIRTPPEHLEVSSVRRDGMDFNFELGLWARAKD